MLMKSLLCPELKDGIPLVSGTSSTLPYLKAIKLYAGKSFSQVHQGTLYKLAGPDWCWRQLKPQLNLQGGLQTEYWPYNCSPQVTDGSAAHQRPV